EVRKNPACLAILMQTHPKFRIGLRIQTGGSAVETSDFGPRLWAGAGGTTGAMAGHPIRILGIDPGLRRTGWGLIEADGNRLIHIACGSLETNQRAEPGPRLGAQHDRPMAG